MARFLENLQKDLFSAVHNNPASETKRMPPSMYSQTVHHHHHPYFSQILFNNSFINHYPPPPLPPSTLIRFGHPSSDRPYPFHLSTPKKRRTKVRFSFILLIVYLLFKRLPIHVYLHV
jgi:hypothetical protein